MNKEQNYTKIIMWSDKKYLSINKSINMLVFKILKENQEKINLEDRQF